MRVVISGYFGYGNTGDEAILAAMLSSMRAIDPELTPIVISGNGPMTARAHGVDTVARMRPAAIWRALRSSEGLVSGGGGLLQDRTSARPVAYYTGVMALARSAGRPYVVHAQGLGPIARAANRMLAAAALRGAARVSLRDQGSIALARAIGVRRPIDLVPDPAIALVPARDDAGAVVVAVRPWGAATEHLDAVREAVRVLAADHRVIALPMHEPVDRDASARVVYRVPGAEVAPATLSLDERLALIGSARLVIGMRLHALVLAAAADAPGVAISYDPKVEAFAARVGMPVAGALVSGVASDRILEAARQEWSLDRSDRRTVVETMRAEATESVSATMAALRRAAAGA
jgi:polysaccharide pyruvyl transferase CsaB